MTTITKKKIINDISRKNGVHPNQVQLTIQDFLDYITESLAKGERFEFRDFGIFETVTRKKKVGRNPKKADTPIIIPPRRTVKFTSGKKLKELIAK